MDYKNEGKSRKELLSHWIFDEFIVLFNTDFILLNILMKYRFDNNLTPKI